MHREVFALLSKDNNEAPPLFPTNTGRAYKQVKAKLGMKKAHNGNGLRLQIRLKLIMQFFTIEEE